jgi:Na+/pantothenate symporter
MCTGSSAVSFAQAFTHLHHHTLAFTQTFTHVHRLICTVSFAQAFTHLHHHTLAFTQTFTHVHRLICTVSFAQTFTHLHHHTFTFTQTFTNGGITSLTAVLVAAAVLWLIEMVGGMRAVAYSDVLQGFVLIVSRLRSRGLLCG